MERNSNERPIMTQQAQDEILIAEDAYNNYMNRNHGPLWGEDNETEANTLVARIRALYEQYDVDEFDRIVGI
jgi:hypothetical protein